MVSTSVSLLNRLKDPQHEEAAWHRFVELYTPMIFRWAQNQQLAFNDAEDLVQEVMTVLVNKLPEFDYDPSQSFRGWLRRITSNKARDFYRRRAARPDGERSVTLDDVTQQGDIEFFEEAEYRAQLAGRAMQLLKGEFRETTWLACWRHLIEGRPIQEVARELEITPNAVYIAKSRVLRRLRQELDGMLE